MSLSRWVQAIAWSAAITVTMVASTLAIAGPHGPTTFGSCYFSGCNCRSFVGFGYTCENCGHNSRWH
jgi:hypothetical protein